MRLIELIDYLVTPDRLPELYRQQGIDEDAVKDGYLTIYMAGTLSLESSVRLFSDQETDGQIHVHKEGIEYVYVLEVDLAVDLLASDPDLQRADVTNLTRANRVLHYAIYDA